MGRTNSTALETARSLSYYASIVLARNPMEVHRQMTDSMRSRHSETRQSDSASVVQRSAPSDEGPEVPLSGTLPTESGLGLQRFRAAVGRVRSGISFRKHARAINDPQTEASDRLAHLVRIEQKLQDHPHRTVLIESLRKSAQKDYKGVADYLGNELFILGEKIFGFFTPRKFNEHELIFTYVFFLILVVTFFYMAGQYPRWLEQHKPSVDPRTSNVPEELRELGPGSLWDWVVRRGDNYQFKASYLTEWGGRIIPKMEGGSEGYRWVTALFLHQSFAHVFNNVLIFLLFSTHLEHKYGTWRIGLLCLLSGLGGNFLSAAFEDACDVVVGASGSGFGLLGLFVADMVLNFEQVSFPILRTFFLLLMLGLFIYTVLTEGNTSHVSHVGGFLAGLFPSFIFLPNLQYAKWEAILPYLGAITLVFFYLVLPIYIYADVIPNNDC